MMQPEEAASFENKRQNKRLLAERHTGPFVLSFAVSRQCLLYHQPAKAQPI